MNRPEAAGLPGLPPGADEPVFAEPWQAQAFAMVVALHDRGLFAWDEWASALSAELKRSDADPHGQDYYEHWLAALERLLASKEVADAPEVEALAEAWQRAAHATPHGKAIVLANDPLTGGSRG